MKEPPRIQLFSKWSAHGFDDADEEWETATLSVGEGNISATATLAIEDRQQTTPRRGEPLPATVTTTRYTIGVQELVALIKKHGRSEP